MNGSVECWGRDQLGQSTPPENKFMQISLGFEKHACGITIGGDVMCWGSNSRGQGRFSDGETQLLFANSKFIFIKITIIINVLTNYWYAIGPFIQVSSGVKSTCAIHSNHTIECWGQWRHPIPSKTVSNTTSYQHISLGMNHACALDDNKKVQCWHSGPDVGAHVVPLGFISK